ncbi:Fungal specific transcription factor [Akanthomyces lecanii RCEF 1005]|uniref:Fungal specific transcription factor n=1 Tax=Akanthomyces lecanii RCEF 1005 TaxID=1081108 RepID=A0A168DL52_CORDF|nr:Fungal specific transcription factor [Akanthomyces lecanii RCEF 1005]
MADSQFTGPNRVAIPRPQVGIERLAPRRQTNEPRESMNCKSCRKRKIKCNRLRPSCEACQLFQCPCVYDAVPKKRGPKTDVLEALLKRVDGLEAKLKEKNVEDGTDTGAESSEAPSAEPEEAGRSEANEPPPKRFAIALEKSPSGIAEPRFASSETASADWPATLDATVPTETLINAYFTTIHGKPYFIVDESTIHQRMQLKQLPQYLVDAMCASVSKLSAHPKGHLAAVQASLDLALRARQAIDLDEISMEAIQALLLICLTFIMVGKGAKAYMALNNAISMALGLELHREMDTQAQVTQAERETRRRLFWTCYQLDRLLVCGSKRPGLISDDAIVLRLPSWSSKPSSAPTEGEFFHCGSNLQYLQGSGKKSQGSSGMLIDICRILGITSKYLAAGGVKGDSHFPWHSLSNLSKIRQDLDTWASGTNNAFATIESLFGQSDATALFMSKMLYHLIHCLIYRPFLPIDLAELSGNGQHQSWQIEATTMCFLHANAITELADLARQTGRIQMPGMTGYCIFTAATVHVHGIHYNKSPSNGDMAVFLPSSELLAKAREMLSGLRYIWAAVEQHRENLEEICVMHGRLVNALASNSIRYTPGFQLEDHFDRYSNVGGSDGNGRRIDGTSFRLKNISTSFMADPYAFQVVSGILQQSALKRKNTGTSSQGRTEMIHQSPTSDGATFYHNRDLSGHSGHTSDASAQGVAQMHGHDGQGHHTNTIRSTMEGYSMNPAGTSTAGMSAYSFSPATMTASSGMAALSYSPAYSYNPPMGISGSQAIIGPGTPSYDPMFGTIPTNAYGSPAAWHGVDVNGQHRNQAGATVPSPSTKSNTGSTGTQGDEKDPFMTLLEQLAENEQRFNNGTGELDFFLAGAGVETR